MQVDHGEVAVELTSALRCRIGRSPGNRVLGPRDPIGQDPETELGDGSQPGADGGERREPADDRPAAQDPGSRSIGQADSSADPGGPAEVTDA
ncbi:MAG: hypothetical protein ABI628_01860 [Chloroflexota bacterium]